jgi:ribulose-bisphosphate carboxylase small chain
MRLETFSYLPELEDQEIAAQVEAIVARGLVVAIEHTEQPDPYDPYWSLWKLPLFAVSDVDIVMDELAECRRAYPDAYVRVNGYDARRQGQVVSFVAHRPSEEA